jgi:hypothetical protein
MPKGSRQFTIVGLLFTAGASLLLGRGMRSQGQAAANHQPMKVETVLIGCLEQSGRETFTLQDFHDQKKYVITAPPAVVGPADSLAWHVGHELEIHGTFQAGRASEGGTLKATSIIYISTTCWK